MGFDPIVLMQETPCPTEEILIISILLSYEIASRKRQLRFV
jgi:hypothetical protein